MEPTIPVHYHQLPLITGTDIVYEEALPLWDMNAKRIVVGDGVTPGGVLIPNFNDDLSYVRKFILADTTAVTKDWLICTTSLTVNLPSDVSAMAVVRISTLSDAEPVTVKSGDTVVLSMGSSTTVELVYGESGWVITENTSAASDMGDYLKREALMLNGAAAQLVSFKSMTQAAYDLITPVIDAIYFIRDTGKLIFNGVVYGSGGGGGGGEPGVSTYLYVAYAADDTGSGFSLVPTGDLPYRAEIHVHVEIQNPTLSDFADAVWIKYIATGGGSGEGGTPSQAFTKTDVTVESTGDNQNAAYLTLSTLLTVVGILDNEGVQWNLSSGAVKRSGNSTVVDISSVLADKGITSDNIVGTWYVLFAAGEGGSSGGAVSWGDITGKPSTYPPAAHTHEIDQVNGLQEALNNAGKVKSVNGQLPDENGNITIDAGEGTVKSVNGVLPDASGNVTIETGSTVDEGRLLPANASDKDIPIFDATSTIGGGNDETTKFLIQIPAGGSLITDTAAGNAAPVQIENNGVSVNAAGAMVFNGSGYLKIAANTLPADLMGQDMDYTIDILYTATSKSRQCLFGRGDSPRMDFLLDSNGSLQIGGGPNLGTGWPFDTEVLLTFECWKEDTVWRYTCYRDGAAVTSGTWGSSNWRGSDMWIGWEGNTGGRELTGQIKALRLSNTALHKGTAFSPDYPWSIPKVVGEWGTINKSELISKDSNRLLPAPDTVPSDNIGNPVVFKAASRIDNTYLLCLPFNEDTKDRSTYNVETSAYGTAVISSNAPATPGGSLYMSGSNCVHGTLPVVFGTLDFTVRFWLMAPAISSSSYPRTMFSTRQGNATSGSTFALHGTEDGKLFIYSNTDITSRNDVPSILQAGTWYHIAIVRSSGTVTIYVNGQTYASGTFTNNLTRQIFGIGSSWTGSSYDEAGIGYITSLDVLNYAAYTGPFEVPEYKAGILSDMKYLVASSEDVKDLLTKAGLAETRMLPALDTAPESRAGNPVVFDYRSGIDADTLCLLHLDDSTWADATGKNTVTQHGSVAKVSDNGYFDKALDLSGNLSSGSLSWLTVPWLADYESDTWTIEFFAKPTKAVVNFMFFSFGNSQGSYLSLGSQNLSNLWLGNGSGTYTGNFSFGLSTWYWIVMQYDGSAVKVYVDGQLVVEGNFTPNYIGQDLQFGNLNLVNNQDNTFIGYLDEFRWSKGLRYPTGVMTAPTEPYGTPAKSYKVSEADLVFSDSTRLLPETPDNGAIPCFNSTPPEGVNYNDSHTVMLVQGSTTNMALGTKLPFMVTGTVSAQEDGSLLFPSGSDKLVTTSAAEVKRVFGDEFTVDVYMKPTQFNNTSRQDTNFFYLTGPSTYYIYGSNYNNSGSAVQDRWGVWAYSGQRVITLPNAEYHHAALDVYLVSGSRKYTIYYDGVPVLTGDWYTDGLATAEEATDAVITFFGTSGEASLTNAYVKALRVSDIARYKGVQFTPPAHGTYDNPPAGYWDTVNKSEFKATRVRILSRDPSTRLAVVQPLRLRNGVWETDPDAPEKTVKY